MRCHKQRKTMQKTICERTGHVVQKSVFVSEHRSWSDNGNIRECYLDCDLAFCLAPVELRGRVQRRIQVRDVDKFRNTTLLCDASDRFGTGYMHGVEIEIPRQLRLGFATRG
jgi:hypothetical protein